MRTLIDIIGGILVASGIICVLGGLVVRTVYPSGGIMQWTGGVMVLEGWLICYLAGTKACPRCNECVKVKALKCKHCSTEFADAMFQELLPADAGER